MVAANKKLYMLSSEEQEELLKLTEDNTLVVSGRTGTVTGDVTKLRQWWKRLAKKHGFKVKTIEPCKDEDTGYYATPIRTKLKPGK